VLEDRVKELPCLLRVFLGQQLHRSFEVSKQHRNLFALTLKDALGSQNLLGEVLGRICLWRRKPGLFSGRSTYLSPALETELGLRWKLYPALGTVESKVNATFKAKFCI
jgi:hypothetical protein